LDGDTFSRLRSNVTNTHDELGRFADLNFAGSELLDFERWPLWAFERFFARTARAFGAGRSGERRVLRLIAA
jgi:hypothetical protein